MLYGYLPAKAILARERADERATVGKRAEREQDQAHEYERQMNEASMRNK